MNNEGKKKSVFEKRLLRRLDLGLALSASYALVTLIVYEGISQSFDAYAAFQINHFFVSPLLLDLMSLASNYGREYFWIGLVLVMLLFGKQNTKILALELIVLFAVGVIAGDIAKFVFFRERPYGAGIGVVNRMPPDTDSSYPSGHALIVSIGAFFAFLTFREKIVPILLAIEAGVVCYSRVYLGLHYPLDVLGGILLGGAIATLGIYVIEKYFSKQFSTLAHHLRGFLQAFHIFKEIF